jgi:hypothetical protein
MRLPINRFALPEADRHRPASLGFLFSGERLG